MKKLHLTIFLISLGLSLSTFAEKIIMSRSAQEFPEAMTTLQNSIIEHGYTVSRVQRVDVGLTKAQYKTDKYRVVFFGKQKEIDSILAIEPNIIAYLPLKISIFAEGEETIIVTVNPDQFEIMFPNPKLRHFFNRWRQDLRSIFSIVASEK